MSSRPRILFGDHRTQAPAIERLVDHDRFDVAFAPFDQAEFSQYDLVVPLRIDQIAPARERADADGRRRAVLPSADLVEVCDDKLLFHRRLVALGFGDLLPAVLPEPPGTYPYVRKVRRGDFGQGVRVVRGPGEDDAPPPDSFAQEAVAGRYEYVLHLLRVDGRVRYHLCYRYDMERPLSIRGQAAAPKLIEPADPAPAWDACVAILDALGFEGTCCFNYKHEEGWLSVIELNPRFGGSLVGDVTGYVAAHLEAIR